ncbi:MAG: hypothetical protein HY001_05645 [Candidatus Portnoybacteria bacterium]|nr:hypothetical protein [Candidatus Portnoybacteria bacterium]
MKDRIKQEIEAILTHLQLVRNPLEAILGCCSEAENLSEALLLVRLSIRAEQNLQESLKGVQQVRNLWTSHSKTALKMVEFSHEKVSQIIPGPAK